MRILCCGDRHWTQKDKVIKVLAALPLDTVIIEGEAPGADSMARDVALSMGMVVERFPAQWTRYGRAAGPIRNQQMLDARPDKVIAFHADLEHSKGTKDMVRRARGAGIPVEVIE